MDSTDTLNSLYDYLYNDLFKKYKTNRQTEMEAKWLRNYNAFHKIDNEGEVWKSDEKSEDWRSTTYIDITRQKILAGANFVSDMLFKNSTIPFLLEDPLQPNQLEDRDDFEMETLIKAQFNRSNAREALKSMILDGAIYGEGCVRFYMDEKKKVRFKDTGAGYIKVYEKDPTMKVERVSMWNIFRDIEVDFEDSEGIIERSYITKADLKEMSGDNFVIEENLKKALAYDTSNESPVSSDNDVPSLNGLSNRTRGMELLECWCRVPQALTTEFDEDEDEFDEDENRGESTLVDEDYNDMVYVKVLIAGGYVISYTKVDKEDRPYYNFIWEENSDKFGGIGVGDNVGQFQSVINGAFRAFEDNKKLSGNVMFAGVSSAVTNIDSGFKIGKILELDGTFDSIDEVLRQYVVPDVGESLISVINMAMQMSDMSSGIPRTSQGQESSNPQTAYEIQQRLERAGKYIGQVIVNADRVIAKLGERFYMENMLDDEVAYELKIPYDVKAVGFASYEVRMIRTQKLMQTLQLFGQYKELNENYTIDYLIKEIFQSNDINPKELIKSKEQKEAEAAAQEESNRIAMEDREVENEKTRAETRKLEAETKEKLYEVSEKKFGDAEGKSGTDANGNI